MQVMSVKVGYLETNCYLLTDDTKQTIIIDPGAELNKIIPLIEDNHLIPKVIVITHAHPDHVGAVDELQTKYKTQTMLHEKDLKMMKAFTRLWSTMEHPKVDRELKDGDLIEVGAMKLSVIATPGHSPGGICLYDGTANLFSGDTLFRRGVGRWDLPGGSREALEHSINEKLLKLPPETIIYPGHGPSTTIAKEAALGGALFE